MRRGLLLLALLASSGCWWWRSAPIVPSGAVEDLESAAADDLSCEDLEVRRLTLLTRLVDGCGHRRVYAWDPLREQWILDSIEKR